MKESEGRMNEEERLEAERVSCAAAGGLLLIAGGALVWGACLRWPWLPKAMAAVFLALAAVGLAVALVRSATAHGGAGRELGCEGHCTQRCGAHDKRGAA